MPDTEVRLGDPASGLDVPPGGRGELLVRGPQVVKGYWRCPEERGDDVAQHRGPHILNDPPVRPALPAPRQRALRSR